VRIASLNTTAVDVAGDEVRVSLGARPVSVPDPFAGMLQYHLHNRPNLRTAGGLVDNA
jgi:hypothetical protein